VNGIVLSDSCLEMLCKLDYESGERGSYLGCELDLSLELGLHCDNYLLVVLIALFSF
jgi:hypothetical protein